MFDKETVRIAVGVVLAVIVLRLVKSIMPAPARRQADGSEYMPGQARF